MNLLTALLMGASALFGAGLVLIWMRMTGEPEATGGARGCVAVLVVDRPTGTMDDGLPQEAPKRLRDRVEDMLRRTLPPGATLERRDIDRFLLTTEDEDATSVAAAIGEMRAAVAQTFLAVPEGVIQSTLTAGVVRIRPGEPLSDAAMRAVPVAAEARAQGGDRVAIGGDEPTRVVDPMTGRVETALSLGELSYDLQPIRDLRTGRDVGAEALLRWHRPGDADGVPVAPTLLADVLDRLPAQEAEFLPRLLADTARPVLARPDGFVTINVSGAVLDGVGAPSWRWLQQTLDILPPDRVAIEIVEHAVIARPERTLDLVSRLRARGVRVALDDFGTGLSNLDRLRRLPIDILKVDRAFVHGLGAAGREEAILRHLSAMAAEMALDLIAEGVETEEQAATLRRLGIPYAQGYLFGRPMPAGDWPHGSGDGEAPVA